LQGQLALLIISSLFFQTHKIECPKITLHCDNEGVQKRTNTPHRIIQLKSHKESDADLLLVYRAWIKKGNVQPTVEWVKGHQDEGRTWDSIAELKHLALSNAAMLNCYCDKQAGLAMKNHAGNISVAEVDVLPGEKWAIFATHPLLHKITSNLSDTLHTQLFHERMESYLAGKHRLTQAKLDGVNQSALKATLKCLKPQRRAVYVKVMHNWAPTNAFLHKQDRAEDIMCPLCTHQEETMCHVLQCTHPETCQNRQSMVYAYLYNLQKLNTSNEILSIFEECLAHQFNFVSKLLYPTPQLFLYSIREATREATRHQNIIGWDKFIRGYISSKWAAAQHKFVSARHKEQKKRTQGWDVCLTKLTLRLTVELWEWRNNYVFGQTAEEAKRLARAALQKRVEKLYEKAPNLASRFQPITKVPLGKRLSKSNYSLEVWLRRVDHQIEVTAVLDAQNRRSQLLLRTAFKNASLRDHGGQVIGGRDQSSVG
jgi:hypothetical protein